MNLNIDPLFLQSLPKNFLPLKWPSITQTTPILLLFFTFIFVGFIIAMANDNLILMAKVSHPRFGEMPTTAMDSFSSLGCLSDRESIGVPKAIGVSCSLKRKRPPKIEIPNVLREISADIFKGCSAQGQDDGAVCFSDSGVGVFSLKGKKKFMEDAHTIFSSSNDNKGFFGVYDGHGGSKAAEFVAENLHLKILEMLNSSSENKAKEEAIKAGYLKTDEEFLKQDLSSGACCVTVLIEGQKMLVSNLGDCRVVLCRGGMAEVLTTDHTAAREDERRRIEDKGGYVEFHRGSWRVHGTLAVSRSIGDAHLKNWVVAEPDTNIIDLTKDMEFLVLASDGLWEQVGDQEAVDIVMQSCSSEKKKQVMRFPQELQGGSGLHDCINENPLSIKSPRISLIKSKRIFHPTSHENSNSQLKKSEDDGLCSPLSKSRQVPSAKQMKIKTPFKNNENEWLVEKATGSDGNWLLSSCKELVNLAVSRGSLDDITVMIVDLNHYRKA